jgi:hypothetical protein
VLATSPAEFVAKPGDRLRVAWPLGLPGVIAETRLSPTFGTSVCEKAPVRPAPIRPSSSVVVPKCPRPTTQAVAGLAEPTMPRSLVIGFSAMCHPRRQHTEDQEQCSVFLAVLAGWRREIESFGRGKDG